MASAGGVEMFSISYVIMDVKLFAEFEKFIIEKFAGENLLFYRDVLQFKNLEKNIDFSELKERAVNIAGEYLFSNSKNSINVSAPMRQEVLEMLQLNDSVPEREIQDFGPIADQARDSESSFGGIAFEENSDLFSVIGDTEDVEKQELTRDVLFKVFDDTFREIQTLIDRNFMASFQHEFNTRNMISNVNLSYWEYQGYLSLYCCSTYLQMASQELESVQSFVKERTKLIAGLRIPVGRHFDYQIALTDIVNSGQQEEFQEALPSLFTWAVRTNVLYPSRKTSFDNFERHAKSIQADINGFVGTYQLQKKKLVVVGDDKMEIMATKYQKLKKQFSELNDITVRVKKRASKKASPLEQRKLKDVNRNLKKTLFELQALEDDDRANRRAVFENLEQLELNRMEKVMKIMSALRFNEMKLLSDAEKFLNIFENDLDAVAKADSISTAETEGKRFIERFLNTTNDDTLKKYSDILLRSDPLHAKINFDPSDFGTLDFYLRKIEDLSMSFAKSIFEVDTRVISVFLENSEPCVAIAQRFKKIVNDKLNLSLSPFQEQIFSAMVDDELPAKYGYIISSDITKRYDKMLKVAEESREILHGNKSDSAREFSSIANPEYREKFEEYLKSCSPIRTRQKCARYRELKQEKKQTKEQINIHLAQATNQNAIHLQEKLMCHQDDVRKEKEDLKSLLEKPRRLRKELLAKKKKITRELIHDRFQWISQTLKTFVSEERNYLETLREASNSLNKLPNLKETIKWTSDNILTHDPDHLAEGLQSVLSSDSRNPRRDGGRDSFKPFGKLFKKRTP